MDKNFKYRLIFLVIFVCIVIGYAFYDTSSEYKSIISRQLELQNRGLLDNDLEAEALRKAFDQTNYIQQGLLESPHKIYIIFDPNCGFCSILFDSLEPYVNAKKLSIRWVPLGILHETSIIKSLEILTAEEQIEALKQSKNNKARSLLYRQYVPTEKDIELLKQNHAALDGLVKHVPIVLYKNELGRARIAGGSELYMRQGAEFEHSNSETLNKFLNKVSDKW
ncbi:MULTISPECIES: hypothetical protein [Cysteiniphilum]|uniref:Thioredoxin-like fold domain-containing protein n=1 Tax=Cysteiniphilum litorale TaxID=2056700 RepID=A0A8J2Z6F3_9GAMM|nr:MULTISPECIES: hypothetical protein [Cysteiniphilum]GGG06553.1 hypothetical protein GCM10010995_25080 [Cysteiniphilum litorale]